MYPTILIRFSSSFSAHEQALIQPKTSKEFDFEGEFVIVIGKKANAISKDQALNYVFRYTIEYDGSIRAFQMRTSQWTAGKLMDRSGGIGPAIVTKDELPVGAYVLKQKLA